MIRYGAYGTVAVKQPCKLWFCHSSLVVDELLRKWLLCSRVRICPKQLSLFCTLTVLSKKQHRLLSLTRLHSNCRGLEAQRIEADYQLW